MQSKLNIEFPVSCNVLVIEKGDPALTQVLELLSIILSLNDRTLNDESVTGINGEIIYFKISSWFCLGAERTLCWRTTDHDGNHLRDLHKF